MTADHFWMDRMRRLAVLLCAASVLVTVHGTGSAGTPDAVVLQAGSDGTGPLDTDADLTAALHFESEIPQHTINGMVTPLYYDEWPAVDPDAKPIAMDAAPDSGNYTGVYLASQSFRYAQAKKELKRLGVDPLSTSGHESPAVLFWRGQRDEALARGRQMVEYYHVLVNISKYWKTTFDPKVDTSKSPDADGFIDYGGGVVPAEAGLLMRTCTPVDQQPAWQGLQSIYAATGELWGPFHWEDGRDWYCLAATSRDSYAGTLFGLGVALDFLGTAENRHIRDLLAHDLMTMTDYAAKYLWFQPRPHGKVANPVTSNDLRGPISPLFIQVPLHRLHLVQLARHAAAVVGDAAAKLRYDALWDEEVANTVATGSLDESMVIDAAAPHSTYYKYQLHWMSFFNVIRLEPNPLIRQELRRAMGILDATITDDGNAFYQAISYALTGERWRLDDGVDLHRQWLDYYAFHQAAERRGVTPFVHTGRCGITGPVPPDAPIEQQPLECVPKDQVDMVTPTPAGDVVTPFQPGTASDLRAKDPLPVGVRRLADFRWQKDPTIIGGDHNRPWQGPSIDFLGTYWMLRYYSEIARPALDPLPAWAGPRFR
jgi:hypothetical protein